MPDKIGIVVFCTGEYSDHRTEIIAAYEDLEKARLHVDEAKAWAERWRKAKGYSGWSEVHYDLRDSFFKESPYHPETTCGYLDYTGPDYYSVTVPVLESLPEVK